MTDMIPTKADAIRVFDAVLEHLVTINASTNARNKAKAKAKDCFRWVHYLRARYLEVDTEPTP